MGASTLAEVARLAGVSLASASRVLNGSARTPGPGVAERVRQAAASLGYVPNAQAQGLAKSSSGLIGLIVHDIADPYFSAIARGVQAAARKQNKMVLLATTDGTTADERLAVAAFTARRADSIVIAGSRSARAEDQESNTELAAELDRYCRNGGRVGVVGHPVPGASAPEGYHVVAVPNEELAAGLASRLAANRFAGFVIIGGPEGLLTSDDRVSGFQRGLAAAGLPAAEVLHDAFNRAGGYAKGQEIAGRVRSRESGGDMTKRLCVLACNDVMAIGVAAALSEAGLRVPEDIAVAGFDDIETLRDFRPTLTTVRLPLEEIGQLAAGAAADAADIHRKLTGQIMLRRSTE